MALNPKLFGLLRDILIDSEVHAKYWFGIDGKTTWMSSYESSLHYLYGKRYQIFTHIRNYVSFI